MTFYVDWPHLKSLALRLNLAEVEEATSWGEPCLKAFGKLWTWWSPHEDAPVFKALAGEKILFLENEPETFFTTPHYENHNLILVRKDRFNDEWAQHQLLKTWKMLAPERVERAYDRDPSATPLPKLGKKAEGALYAIDIETLEDLASRTREEITNLAGFGPKAMAKLDLALSAHDLSLD